MYDEKIKIIKKLINNINIIIKNIFLGFDKEKYNMKNSTNLIVICFLICIIINAILD